MTRLRSVSLALTLSILGASLAVFALGAVAHPGTAAKRQPPVINAGSPQSGTKAFATANGSTAPVTVLKLRAKASPKQSVRASGFAKCNGRKKTFTYQGRAPLIRPLPIAGDKPARCSYSVKAQLTGSGTITLDILAR